MTKISTPIIFVFLLVLSYWSNGQSRRESALGNYQDFLSQLNATGNARTSKHTINLKAIDKNFSGIVNFKRSEGQEATFIGSLENYQESNFYIHFTESGMVEGHILLDNKSNVAYKYFSSNGVVKIKEVSPHDVICIGLENEGSTSSNNSSLRVMAPPAGSSAYKLQGFAGAPNVIYLDFDGEYVSGTPWNNGNPINAAPSVFSEAQVIQIWQAIVEDFRPFNVNITTDVTVYNSTPTARKGRCIFTPTNTAAPGSGGVAYLNSFGSSNQNPCWVFGGSVASGAGGGSHEIGHILGLSHDGSPTEAYYSGQGIWSTIMGCSTCKTLIQWSKGEYNGANMTQDDLAIMAGKIQYRTDDHSNTTSGATAIKKDASGNVAEASNNGVISTRTDLDFFSFTTTGGNVSLNIKPASFYPNLDIIAKLYNSSGTVIGTYDPTGTTFSATINANLAAGTYYVSVDGTGQGDPRTTGYSDYASLGYFSISGTIPSSGGGNQALAVSISSPANNATFTAPANITLTANASDADGTIASVSFYNGSTLLSTDNTSPYSYTWSSVPVGSYAITARATDNSGTVTTSAVVNVTVSNSTCQPTAITPYISVNGGAWQSVATATVNVGGSATFGPHPTTGGSWAWTGPNGFTAATREITRTNIQTTHAGSYIATYSNACGAKTTRTFTLTVNGGTTGATVYQHCNYEGTSGVLPIGTYNLSQLISRGISNDWISSLRVPSGLRVVLFEHDNFTGVSITYTADISCLVAPGWNDRASSIRVESNTTTPPPPTGDWSSFQYPNVVFTDKSPTHPGSTIFRNAIPDPVASMKQQILELVKKLHYNATDNIRFFSRLNYIIEDYDGVAEKWGGPPEIWIRVSTRHIQNVYNNSGGNSAAIRTEILGILSHEGTHGYQYEPKNAGAYDGNSDFYGFIEGLADYVRISVGLHPGRKPALGGSWRNGYTTSGFFINWMVRTKDPNFAIKFQHTARTMSTWSWDAACKSILNEGVQSLWDQYQNWIRNGGTFTTLQTVAYAEGMEKHGCKHKGSTLRLSTDYETYKVYLNASHQILNVASNVETNSSKISIYGANTGAAKKTVIWGNSGAVDVSDLAAGLYIITIEDDNSRLFKQKVLIQK